MTFVSVVFLGWLIVISLAVIDTYKQRPVNIGKLYGVCVLIALFLIALSFAVGMWVGSHAY